MKYMKLFEDMYDMMPRPSKYKIDLNTDNYTSRDFASIEKNLWSYVSKFYVTKTSFGKKFINDSNGNLLVEVTAKGKYAMTRFAYFIPYFKDKEGKFPSLKSDAGKILLNVLKKKFPEIQIDGVIFEDR